jgi:ABC-type Na+ transport system ATPase subunit NatA
MGNKVAKNEAEDGVQSSGSGFPGARFYKADLHVHTPASKCWEGAKNKQALEEIFKKLVKEKIDVVAITDHNTGHNIDSAKRLGKQYGIHVFPGVEVSTKEGHVLAIFEPKQSTREIHDWLAKMGFVGQKLGDENSMAEDQDGSPLEITKVFALIEKNGGVAIAPHPNSKGIGFLAVMRQKGLARQVAYSSPNLRGLEVGDDRQKILRLAAGGVSGYEKKYGCIATSDAHKIEDIGASLTYIKMGDFSVSALKQVFCDPAMRIRFQDSWPPKPHAWIERVEVSQGFFDGVEFRFHPDMNCLVGGKAVGKSLLIELMKFVLGVKSPIDEIDKESNEMLGSKICLGDGGTVTLHVVSEDQRRYRIQRTLSDLDRGPQVYYAETQTRETRSVEEIIPCKIYSQNEVIQLGKKLPALLKWLDGFIDLSNERRQISESRGQVGMLLRKLDAHHNRAKRIPSLTQRKADLEAKKEHLEKMLKERILTRFPKWQKEQRELRSFQKGLEKLRREIVEPVKRLRIETYVPRVDKDTPNYIGISGKRDEIMKITTRFQGLGKQLEEVVLSAEKGLQTYTVDWRKRFEAAQREFEKVIKTAGVKNAAALTTELDKVTEALEDVEAELQGAEEAQKQKKGIENQLRGSIIPDFAACFASIYKKRLDKATAITDSLDSFVRIQVLQMHDRSEYREELAKLAKGSRLQAGLLDRIAERTTPVDLARFIIDRNVKELATRMGATDAKAQVLTDHVWARYTDEQGEEYISKLYQLMLAELKDAVTVELKVQDGVYKPMNELSGGSKCTAILSVALVEGDCPLIVDQPEDALDNPFVFEQIVKTVRRSKTGRQYILATHNPNVAVSSDADLIYCLKATATEGGVDKEGSIDEISTRDKVVANLEGGRSAFRLRSQKYDIVVEDATAVVLDILPSGGN